MIGMHLSNGGGGVLGMVALAFFVVLFASAWFSPSEDNKGDIND